MPKVLVSVHWILYSSLAMLAIYLSTGVIKDYANSKTSLGWGRQPLASHPHITLCFNDLSSFDTSKGIKMYALGTEVNITYMYSDEQQGIVLKEGENLLPNTNGESIIVKRGTKCYMIASKSKTSQAFKGNARTIKVEFNRNLKAEELPNQLYFIATSEANSYGLESNVAYEGTPDVTALRLNYQADLEFKVNKFQYLSDVGNGCESRDFWEIVETAFTEEMGNFCPVQCAPSILPSGKLDICPPGFETGCALDVLQRIVNEKLNVFRSPCRKLEYKSFQLNDINVRMDGFKNAYVDDQYGEIVLHQVFFQFMEDPLTAIYKYRFERPEMMTVYEEYVVTSFEDMIGIVGGTLGVYIGFACFDNFLAFVDYLIFIWQKISQLRKRKVSPKNPEQVKEKSLPQNRTNRTMEVKDVEMDKDNGKNKSKIKPIESSKDDNLQNMKKETILDPTLEVKNNNPTTTTNSTSINPRRKETLNEAKKMNEDDAKNKSKMENNNQK